MIVSALILGAIALGWLMFQCVEKFPEYYYKNHCNVNTEIESPNVVVNDCNTKKR
ncbi:hypothetical protein [Wolbachia endosymbiont of Pentidionis agamae]|uniref:hypothetical protein n=1 Tax=Wolbachia endosymbiont of Pentidionis agamae TaxID=3110435 RepID=UPI002FCFF14A